LQDGSLPASAIVMVRKSFDARKQAGKRFVYVVDVEPQVRGLGRVRMPQRASPPAGVALGSCVQGAPLGLLWCRPTGGSAARAAGRRASRR
jgi:hypothetical protein